MHLGGAEVTGVCLACSAEGVDLKPIGYTEKGRGVPFFCCRFCRHPKVVVNVRAMFGVRKKDQEWFDQREMEERARQEAEARR